MMRAFIGLVFLFISSVGLGQDLFGTLTKAATKGAIDKGTKMREALDSVDFQFAMSVNENAGFFDIEQKGETGTKLLYNQKDEADKKAVEKIRDSLEIGIAMYDMRRYQMAEITVRRAQQQMESNSLTNEIVYLRVMSSLGLICLAQGRVSEAEKYIVTTLKMSEERLGKTSAAYIANLNNYAKIHQSQGKYNEAEKEFAEALTLGQQFFGDGMQKAILLNNKAMLSQSIGRHTEATDLMKQAMTASEGTPKKLLQGKKSFDNRRFQANLAFIYQLSGEYQKSEENFLAIQKVFENRGQTQNAEYAGLLNQLGILYIQMGKMDAVESLLKKSKDIYKKRYGEINPYFAKATNDLGNFYRLAGRYPEAETELRKALSVRETWLGKDHPDYVRSQEDLAILLWKTNRAADAYPLYIDVLNKTLSFINEYFPPMSEAEKTNYWDVTSPRFQRFFNFAIESSATNAAISKDLYDYHIATKALLLSSTSKVRSSILASKNQALINDYLQWIDQKEEIARLYSYSKKKLKDMNVDLEALKRSANAMEKSLSERSKEFSAGFSKEKVTHTQLAALLGDDEAAVEIIRVRKFNQDFTDEVQYVALVLKKGSAPKLITLDGGQALETKEATFYRNAIQQRLDNNRSYDVFWKKIGEEVKGRKTVFISPDGVYNQLNLNTLKTPEGSYLLSLHEFVTVGNSKDLIRLKASKAGATKKTALLVGFPDYQTTEVAALPGTKVEIDAVSTILKKQGYAVNALVQKNATESSIKAAANPTLLHIATHGYFLKDTQGTTGSVFGVNPENANDNPLLRAGLILAGAGNAIKGNEEAADLTGDDNGILTAYEAMNLNLDGTNLVILSACETGLGQVKSGEGVYGLQRAFIVAGAEALIMSLWKVDDEATQALMTNFYTEWAKTGNKQKSFKQAQLQLMAKYKEPYYWGAFVMMGN